MPVYFIQEEHTRCIKIGQSKDVKKRLSILQSAHPSLLQLLGTVEGGKQEERYLHAYFSEHHVRGEWYRADQEILDLINLPADKQREFLENAKDEIVGGRQIVLTVKEELASRLESLAKAERRSLATLLRMIIRETIPIYQTRAQKMDGGF